MANDNSICNFCGNYGHKERFCYTKHSSVMWHPMKPINCRRYSGIVLTESQLDQYRRMARESEKIS